MSVFCVLLLPAGVVGGGCCMLGGAKKELIFENKFCGMRIFTYFCSSIMIPALNRCEVVCGCIVVLCAARDLYLCLK